jgi:DNA-binding response OmpR family regulator
VARVLVVEDDADVAQLLTRRLRSYGHVVTSAPSARFAVNAVGLDFPVDVVVMDVNLPGMNGFDLLEELRRHPELNNRKLPCVFLSAMTDAENIARGRSLGATYLTKPFVSGELQGAILQAINGAHSAAG